MGQNNTNEILGRRGLLDLAEQLHWFALCVPPQKEFATQAILEKKGLRTFVPVRREYRRRNKYVKRKELMSYPLAPRYVFAGFEPGKSLWFDLFGLERYYGRKIVTGVVGMGDEPRQLNPECIVSLLKRFGGGLNAPAVQRYMLSNKEFRVGDQVEVIAGPFEGLKVPVKEIRGSRARLVMELFGGEQEVEVPMDVLQAAA